MRHVSLISRSANALAACRWSVCFALLSIASGCSIGTGNTGLDAGAAGSDASNEDAATPHASSRASHSAPDGQASVPSSHVGASRDGGSESPDAAPPRDPTADASAPSASATTEPLPSDIPLPPTEQSNSADVSCVISCGEDELSACDQAQVFVSACRPETQTCAELTPVSAETSGNLWIIAKAADGVERPLPLDCHVPADTEQGLPLDLLFVIDTSDGTQSAVAGIVNSITALLDDLARAHVVARVGAIAFADQAPLMSCADPDAPFVSFTEEYNDDALLEPTSFNYFIANLSAGHCFDRGGDAPANGFDAIEFALGNALATEMFPADSFAWNPDAYHVMVLLTTASQHTLSDGTDIGHFDLDTVSDDLRGFAVVHTVSPDFACQGSIAQDCACNITQGSCDPGCSCDLLCLDVNCPDDTKVGLCDVGAACDPDCPGYLTGSTCDVSVNTCDADPDTGNPCPDDADCRPGIALGAGTLRRCDPTPTAPYADPAELAKATHGAIIPLPSNGVVDLTQLPLQRSLPYLSACKVNVPAGTAALRCIYADDSGGYGKQTLPLD